MKIFATSDIHGNSSIMDKLNIVAADVDLILVCGDAGGKDGRGKTFRQFSEYQWNMRPLKYSYSQKKNPE